jgi:hypothetical protein
MHAYAHISLMHYYPKRSIFRVLHIFCLGIFFNIFFLLRSILLIPSVSLWLAAFCWTKSLLCNDVYYTGMLFYLESTLQFTCILPDDVVFRPNAHLSSIIRSDDENYGKTTATVQTTWLFHQNTILDKASHAEDVQPSGRQTTWFGCSSLNMKIACS